MFCQQCGAQMDDNAKFCPGCGAPAAADASTDTAQQSAYQSQQSAPTQEQPPVQNSQQAPKGEPVLSQKDISDNKAMAILSYIGPLVFIPFFAAKNSAFARYHSLRGMNFLILCAIASLCCSILSCIPVAGWLVSSAVSIFELVLMILGIVNAAQGVCKDLPVIGKIRIVSKNPAPEA